MTQNSFDVAIVGGGPAGGAAAILLAQAGHRVALIERSEFPRVGTKAGWLNALAVPALQRLGLQTRRLLESPIRDVTFYNADLSKNSKPQLAEPPGFLIDRNELCNAMVVAGQKIGVTVLDGRTARHLWLEEAGVRLQIDPEFEVTARLLLMATGLSVELLRQAIPRGEHARFSGWCAQVDALLPTPTKSSALSVVFGLDRHGGFGLCGVSKHWVTASVNLIRDRADAVDRLGFLCKSAFDRGLVPVNLSTSAASAVAVSIPSAAGLDMETHVGKHSLVIGDAGGFVSAASNEGLFPAIWSAELAAEVMDTALKVAAKGGPAQDELMRFDSLWRMKMADYLRAPHTDIQFILPLVFSNQPMANRMARAFFWGENM